MNNDYPISFAISETDKAKELRFLIKVRRKIFIDRLCSLILFALIINLIVVTIGALIIGIVYPFLRTSAGIYQGVNLAICAIIASVCKFKLWKEGL